MSLVLAVDITQRKKITSEHDSLALAVNITIKKLQASIFHLYLL